VNLSAQPQSITPGSSAVLTWTSSNASSLSIDNGIGAVQLNGSVSVTPSQTTTFHATASGPGGTAQAMATVTVGQSTVQFSASPSAITFGQSSTLSWSAPGATTVEIQGVGTFPASTTSVSVSPVITTTYNLVATDSVGNTLTASTSVTVTNSAGTASPVEHIVVVLMQNNTFDHLFGFFPPPTGNTVDGPHAGVPGFAQTDAAGNFKSPFLLTDVAPPALPEGRSAYLAVIDNGLMDKFAMDNGDISMGYYDNTIAGISTLWSYAQQFALADHYFQSVIGEAPSNQLYMIAASDDNFPFSVQPSFGPCQKPDPAAKPLTFPHVGDQLSAKGVVWTVFQENYTNALAGNCASFNPEHDPFQYFVSTNNTTHIQDFSNFHTQLQSGTLPPVTFVIPGSGHDMHPGNGPITAGITFLDNLITEIRGSALWNNTAVVIAFDDGGGWYDHEPPATVDSQGLGFRLPLLVISPWAKKGYVSHVPMDHVSILKFIQFNWGLSALGQAGTVQNGRNLQGNDISDMFQLNPPPSPLP
jgi:phospholipase C